MLFVLVRCFLLSESLVLSLLSINFDVGGRLTGLLFSMAERPPQKKFILGEINSYTDKTIYSE